MHNETMGYSSQQHPLLLERAGVRRIKSISYNNLLPQGIGIYTTFMVNKTMHYNSPKLPLLLERVGVRRIKSSSYNPLIPTFSLKGERSEGSGAGTCVDTYALRESVARVQGLTLV